MHHDEFRMFKYNDPCNILHIKAPEEPKMITEDPEDLSFIRNDDHFQGLIGQEINPREFTQEFYRGDANQNSTGQVVDNELIERLPTQPNTLMISDEDYEFKMRNNLQSLA